MESSAPTERPSSAPKVLGILSIVFGGLTTLMSLVGFSMSGATSMGGFPGGEEAMNRYLAAIEPGATILMAAMIAMSAALIAIGVGQLGYRQWARKAAIIWSLVGLVGVVGMVAHHYMVVVPSFHHLTAIFESDPTVARMMEGMTSSAGLISIVMYAPYPIIQLMLMRKPSVVASMNR